MNKYDKIKLFCNKFRIVLGLVLIGSGFYFTNNTIYNVWFALGIIPLIAGITKFCPLCIITKKCTV